MYRYIDNWIMYLLLIAVTGILYWPVIEYEFLFLDDPAYVVENEHVLKGLTLDGIFWALGSMQVGNWHPLTWISHMLDVEWFGMSSGYHHLTNVFFHAANGVLLVLFLSRATGAVYPSLLVGLLFLLHPAHIESVAWVSERKDVLSTFFFMLVLNSYLGYFRKRTAQSLLLVCLFLLLGLMSKAMLVTVPVILLLLDIWPLKRLSLSDFSFSALIPLVKEKLLLFALALLVVVLTYLAQHGGGAMHFGETFTLLDRLANAFVSVSRYFLKFFYPVDLAVFYPHPGKWPLPAVSFSVVFVFGVTLLTIWQANKRPYLIAGWMFFLVTLMPVIGIVQIGAQSIADRYTYIPYVGIFIMFAWGLHDIVDEKKHWLEPLVAVVLLMIISHFLLSSQYLRTWRNDTTLLENQLDVFESHYLDVLTPAATEDYLQRVRHRLALSYLNEALSLLKSSEFISARNKLLKSISYNEKDYRSWQSLATIELRKGNYSEAELLLLKAASLAPTLKPLFDHDIELIRKLKNKQ